jgi:hypothetical protein
MPLKDGNKGKEKDGSFSELYCNLCYVDGGFFNPKMTVEEMQAICTKALREKHWPGFLIKMATNNIPKLGRWKTS